MVVLSTQYCESRNLAQYRGRFAERFFSSSSGVFTLAPMKGKIERPCPANGSVFMKKKPRAI